MVEPLGNTATAGVKAKRMVAKSNRGTLFALQSVHPGPRMLWRAVFLFALFRLGGSAAAEAPLRASPGGEEEAAKPAAWAQAWQRSTLQRALNRLSDQQQVTFFLDRRINPDALVSGDFPRASLAGLLEVIQNEHRFSVTVLDSIIYLGPADSARRLRTIDRLRTSEVRALGASRARGLSVKSTLRWPDLASPRDLVLQVCRDAQITLTNPDRVPHDLWAAGKLPNLARVSQLTLLLAGFDLTFDSDVRGTLTVRLIHDDELWQQEYTLRDGSAARVEDLEQQMPEASLRVSDRRLHVIGRVEDHEVVERWVQYGNRPPSADEASDARQTYSLRVVRKPLRDVLRALESGE